jgi:hypothetical protein
LISKPEYTIVETNNSSEAKFCSQEHFDCLRYKVQNLLCS